MKKGLIIFEHIFRIPVIVHSAVRWGKNASKRTERHGEVFKRIFLTVRSPACQLVLRPHFFADCFYQIWSQKSQYYYHVVDDIIKMHNGIKVF